MNNKEFIAYTAQHKIVPVYFHEDTDTAIKVVQASYDGGIRIFEFVNRGKTGLATFQKITQHFKDYRDLKIGVGTIFDSQTAREFIKSGAQFIVSPGLVNELAEFCEAHDVAYIPGVGTITEAITAMHLKCEMIKLFPANVIGSAFAKAVKSVMPQLAIMPTGGIEPTRDSMKEWFAAGVNCVGMGSQLFNKQQIKDSNFTTLTADIERSIAIYMKILEEINSTD
jgi:2-dehydro-3-deoxyphosphogluconate aldolase/(4S)-4-hydroxy-2-oxoglutarate aldolase